MRHHCGPSIRRQADAPGRSTAREFRVDAGAALDHFLSYVELVNARRYAAAAAPRRALMRLGLHLHYWPGHNPDGTGEGGRP